MKKNRDLIEDKRNLEKETWALQREIRTQQQTIGELTAGSHKARVVAFQEAGSSEWALQCEITDPATNNQ